MKRKLTLEELKFNVNITESKESDYTNIIPQYKVAYKKIERALSIQKEGYNLYLIDSFSKGKIQELKNFIERKYKDLDAPKDICYVTLEDTNKPEAIFVSNSKGKILKEEVENIKSSYLEVIENFYSDSNDDEKDRLVEEIQSKRENYLNELMQMSKEEGFEVKATNKGFAFVPLSGTEVMTEKEYDELEQEKRTDLANRANILKKHAEVILEELKEMEINSIRKLKKIYSKYLASNMEEHKDNSLLEFITEDDSYEYLERLFSCIEEELVGCYSMSIEEDENEIYEVLNKYNVEVIVDNSKNFSPPVIFEEDPSLNNLVGTVEYENHNGLYTTNISLITAGSIIKANEGCLILRLSSLVMNPQSYYSIKRILLSNKVSFDSNKNYMDLININGLKPQAIPVNVKVILIGDYESYDILYNSDEDFRKLFQLKAEFSSVVEMTDYTIDSARTCIDEIIKRNRLIPISNSAIGEIIKYLCRKSSSKNKISFDLELMEKLLILGDNRAIENNRENIEVEDIINIAYEEEIVEEQFMEVYKDKKMIINVKGSVVGSINGLAVLDTGYHTFGKPMRITCVAKKGSGRIIDIQKESSLSGKIHQKSINILKGLLSNLFDPYEELPIDVYLSFEQTYGIVEGDSASVAEIICILSAISKRPIRQYIAVTGSINQFGEVQPIGGINEKIEGFHKVCRIIDNTSDKGVLMPKINIDELVLKSEVEEDIEKGNFNIYVMETLKDAIETLILQEDESVEEFYELIKVEIGKYKDKKKTN